MNSEQIGDILVIELPQRLDAVGVGAIEQKLSDMISEHKGNALADLSGVDFVASLALRMLITNLKAAQALGGDLRLCCLQPQIAEIFRKSRFDTLFKIFASREEALESFKG